MLHNDHGTQDPFDPFHTDPIPPKQEPTQDGQDFHQDDAHDEQEKRSPLYGPDFFSGRPTGNGPYNPFGGNGFYARPSENGSSSQPHGDGQYFGADYFSSRQSTTTYTSPQPTKEQRNTLGITLGILSIVFSTICSILFFIGLPIGIGGIVVNVKAIKKGASNAVAGIITSVIGTLFSLLYVVLFAFLFAMMANGEFDYAQDPNINGLFLSLQYLFH